MWQSCFKLFNAGSIYFRFRRPWAASFCFPFDHARKNIFEAQIITETAEVAKYSNVGCERTCSTGFFRGIRG